MTDHLSDEDILARIRELVAEEESLREPGSPMSPEERSREQSIEVALDRCWDLLRQRRARREFDRDPDEAEARDEMIVEHYQQ